MRLRTQLVLLTLAVAFAGLAPSAPAQKARVGRKYFEDHHYGYRFRYPDGWMVVPVRQSQAERGVLTKMDGPAVNVRVGNAVGQVNLNLQVLKFEPRAAVTRTEDEGTGGLRERVKTDSSRPTIADYLQTFKDIWGLRDFEAEEPKEGKAHGLPMRYQAFRAFNGQFDLAFHTYTFPLTDYDIVLVFLVPREHERKWVKVFTGCAKTFEIIEREAAVALKDERTASYEELLAYYRDQASRTEGWEVLETPSQRYIVLTSSDDRRFLQTLISRLEASRDLFERDFPPSRPLTHVSVLRVCSTYDEFLRYGGIGAAGYFNPGTTELVIVDFKDVNRNLTYGVLTHEAFHQYCHFLFDESEAHRWFDEGHGDYYAAAEFRGRKVTIRAKMKGEDRLTQIRQMIRDGTYKPIGDHIRFNHPQWQNQGPTPTSPYCESWSIIYYLRQGMAGKVSSKVWRKEYADIIPNYIRVLHEEYLRAYDEIREEMKKEAEQEGVELAPEDLAVHNLVQRLSEERKQEIWKKAIAASWGKIDIFEFESLWRVYVLKHIRN